MGLILFVNQLVLATLVNKIVTIFILIEKMAEKVSIMLDCVNYQRECTLSMQKYARRSLNEKSENEKKISLCKLLAFTI